MHTDYGFRRELTSVDSDGTALVNVPRAPVHGYARRAGRDIKKLRDETGTKSVSLVRGLRHAGVSRNYFGDLPHRAVYAARSRLR